MKPANKKISIILSLLALVAFLVLPSLKISAISNSGIYILGHLALIANSFYDTFIFTGLIATPLLAIWFATDNKRYKWLSGTLLLTPCLLAFSHFNTDLGMMIYVLCALGALAIPILRHSNGRNFQRVREIAQMPPTKDTTFIRLISAVVVILVLDLCLIRCAKSTSEEPLTTKNETDTEQADTIATKKKAERINKENKKKNTIKKHNTKTENTFSDDECVYQYVHVVGNNICLRVHSDKAVILQDKHGHNIHVGTGMLMKVFGEENGYYKVVHDNDTCYILKQFAKPVGL